MNISDPKKILYGYLTQLIRGCDNVRCLNEYCSSCKDFKYKFSSDNDNQEAKNEALRLLKIYSKENHLCNGVLLLYFDTKEFENKADDFCSIINSINFDDIKIEFDREKVISYMKDFDLLPYLFAPGGKLCDNKLDQLFEYIMNNNEAEPFLSLKSLLPDFVKKLTESSPIMNTKYHFNHCIIVLLYLTIFPTDEFSELFSKVILHIDRAVAPAPEVNQFFISQFGKISKLVKRILSFAQDNLTYATINGQDPQSPEMIGIARLFELLRKSNLDNPSSIFSNEPFTDLLNVQTEVEKIIKKTESYKYLETPAALTLPFKFECLSFFYQIIQFTFSQAEFIQILLNPNLLNQRFFTILVKRSKLYENTMEILSQANPDQLSRHLRVIFEGEEGVDAGGVSREFFYLNCNEIFSDKYGMFFRLSNGKYWFRWPIAVEPIFFKTLGTLVFLAVYNSIILPIRFPMLLYKKILHLKLVLEDYEEIDQELVSSLKYLREMKKNGEDISKLETTFSITRDNFGQLEEIPLCEGGEKKIVTNDNVEEYIDLYADWLMNKSVETQYRSFENGFNIISTARGGKLAQYQLISLIFNYDELDILVSGEEIVNWEQLKVNAQYTDGYEEDSKEVKWFWEIFDEMTEDQKKTFFRFSTGSGRAPVGGLDFFHLKIQKVNDPLILPVAHTCMNIFSLPAYSTKEEMKQKVLFAIENTEGFGLI